MGATLTTTDTTPGTGHSERDAVRETVRRALDVPRQTMPELAAALGVPRATLESYRIGARGMPAHTRRQLAAVLARHAADVEAAAAALLTMSDAAL